jgi:hypothetical protein
MAYGHRHTDAGGPAVRVKTYNGITECDFETFASAEPRLRQIREDFRAKKIDADAVFVKVRPLFGTYRVHAEWDKVVGDLTATAAIKRWQEWVDEDPLRVKLFYSPEVVSGTITQEVEDVL